MIKMKRNFLLATALLEKYKRESVELLNEYQSDLNKLTEEDNIMPAKSEKQRKAMAIAEHHPDELYKRNKGLKKMSKNQLHDFASTKESKLPKKAKKKSK